MERSLEKWGRFVARWPWLILILWVAVVAVAWIFGPSLGAVAAKQNSTSSLPTSARSDQANQIYTTKFAAGQKTVNKETDIIILSDPQGISAQDSSLATQIQSWLLTPGTLPSTLLTVNGPGAQTPGGAFESSDHQALSIFLTWDTTHGAVSDTAIAAINTYLAHLPVATGGFVGLTGSEPISYSLNTSVFTSGGSSAALGSLIGLLIILAVLGIVYRSPLAVLIPLLTTGMAVALSVPVIAWLGQTFNISVASFSLEYVAFVLLGAGTNYGVFMLSRYKEEIRRGNAYDRLARQNALSRAVGHIGESITSSALTVVVSTAIMGLAQLYELHVTGPAIAAGVVCLLLAGLSLLPALMALCGKALFWPVQPRPGTLNDTTAPEKGFWARAGSVVTKHPVSIALIVTILLLPLALVALTIDPSFDDLKALPDTNPAVQTFNLYSQHFPDASQAIVILSEPGQDLRQATYGPAIAQVAAALTRVKDVQNIQVPSSADTAAQTQQFFATDGSAVALTLALNVDPSSAEAQQDISAIYSAAASAQSGTSLAHAQVVISGQSSTVYDEGLQFNHDFALVVILVCIAIYIILSLLVRSFTAPLYLLATIALSALAAVGITNLVYHNLLGDPLFSVVPIFAFVFLVSLGEDFNILTIARIREEVGKLGHRPGIRNAIALTGGVVSSCGLVMAASFSRLISNQLLEIAELGFTVLVGILIDTFLVRPLLMPALTTLLGRWNWVWPGNPLFKQSQKTEQEVIEQKTAVVVEKEVTQPARLKAR
jgi:putative drug exporter of the RND superfamily